MRMDSDALISLLGEKNVEIIKNTITDAIINNIEESIEKEYLVLPSEIDSMMNDIFEEMKEELMQEYREAIKKKMKAGFEAFLKEEVTEEDFE